MRTLITLILLWISIACYAQKSLNALQIGDKVPNVSLGKILNHSFGIQLGKTELFTEDLKGKLVILDFWAATCSVCIQRFPKMEALQREFGDKIVILAVGSSQRRSPSLPVADDLSPLIKKWKGTEKELKLPSTRIVSPDSELNQLFRFAGVPTYVVIDANGIFRLMTQAVLDKEDIHHMLDSKFKMYEKYNYNFKSKVHPKYGFLIKDTNNSTLRFDSSFSSYIDSLRGIPGRLDTVNSKTYRFYAANVPIWHIYHTVYNYQLNNGVEGFDDEIITTPALREKLAIGLNKDPNLYHIIKGPALWEKYYYCYEAIGKKEDMSYKEFCKQLILDLDQKFGVISSVVCKKVKVEGMEQEIKVLEFKISMR